MIPKNFIMVIGGPMIFHGKDPSHDTSWSNYLIPVQLAHQRELLNKDSDEVVHWLVYEPAYRKRWEDDSFITKGEKNRAANGWMTSAKRLRIVF